MSALPSRDAMRDVRGWAVLATVWAWIGFGAALPQSVWALRSAQTAPIPAIDTSGVPDEAVAAVAEQLNCPTCQGYTLRDCPLTVCAQMREQIRARLAEGLSEQAIMEEFVDYYGPQVLNAPPREGFFLLAWWLPPIALVMGALLLALWVRGARGPANAPAAVARSGPPASPPPEGYAEAFERLADRGGKPS